MALSPVGRELNMLIKLDVDAMHCYLQAIQHTEYVPVREKLGKFLEDHEHHAVTMAQLVGSLGEEPTEFSKDFKGFFLEGFTSLMGMTGMKAAMEAMRLNEKFINRKYREALDMDLPPDIRTIVGKHYSDEQHHLEYLEEVLRDHPWERH